MCDVNDESYILPCRVVNNKDTLNSIPQASTYFVFQNYIPNHQKKYYHLLMQKLLLYKNKSHNENEHNISPKYLIRPYDFVIS